MLSTIFRRLTLRGDPRDGTSHDSETQVQQPDKIRTVSLSPSLLFLDNSLDSMHTKFSQVFFVILLLYYRSFWRASLMHCPPGTSPQPSLYFGNKIGNICRCDAESGESSRTLCRFSSCWGLCRTILLSSVRPQGLNRQLMNHLLSLTDILLSQNNVELVNSVNKAHWCLLQSTGIVVYPCH